MILEVDNVELSFSNRVILNGIYLKAESGKVCGILGSNGSGKSCLLQIVFGSMRPKYKLVRIDDMPMTKPLYLSRQIKLLPQYSFVPTDFGTLKAFELFKVNWEMFVADFPDFNRYKHYKMNRLSGGEQRVIEIYLTLNSPSKIVLLDEPFSHLSPLFIEKVQAIIEKMKKDKVIVITDHMYRHILETSDRIYLLKNGHTKLISDQVELEDLGYLNPGSL